MKKEKSCGCIVFDGQGRVLVVHMREGHWSFPKGHVEINETETETAYREVLEETNIKVLIDSGFREVSTYSPFPGVMKDVIFFIGKATNDNISIQEEEIRHADFYSPEEAKKLITFDNDQQIFRKALKYLKEQ